MGERENAKSPRGQTKRNNESGYSDITKGEDLQHDGAQYETGDDGDP